MDASLGEDWIIGPPPSPLETWQYGPDVTALWRITGYRPLTATLSLKTLTWPYSQPPFATPSPLSGSFNPVLFPPPFFTRNFQRCRFQPSPFFPINIRFVAIFLSLRSRQSDIDLETTLDSIGAIVSLGKWSVTITSRALTYQFVIRCGWINSHLWGDWFARCSAWNYRTTCRHDGWRTN